MDVPKSYVTSIIIQKPDDSDESRFLASNIQILAVFYSVNYKTHGLTCSIGHPDLFDHLEDLVSKGGPNHDEPLGSSYQAQSLRFSLDIGVHKSIDPETEFSHRALLL